MATIQHNQTKVKSHVGSSTFRLGWISAGLDRSLPRSSSLSAIALFRRPQLPRFLKLNSLQTACLVALASLHNSSYSLIMIQVLLLLFTWLWKGLDSRGSLCSGCSLLLKLTHRITSACGRSLLPCYLHCILTCANHSFVQLQLQPHG